MMQCFKDECPVNTYEIADIGKCELCDEYCEVCDQQNLGDCLKCVPGTTLYDGKCHYSCPYAQYRYFDPLTNDMSCEHCS